MARIRVLNPVARSMVSHVNPAPRAGDLDGKRIGLYWNVKSGGDAALRRAAELSRERYSEARFADYQGDVGAGFRHITARLADRIAGECDAMIGTSSD